MNPFLSRSAGKLLLHSEILGVLLWRGKELDFHQTAPCFTEDQIHSLGDQIHELFAGYRSMGREIPDLSVLFEGGSLHVRIMADKEGPLYLVVLAETTRALVQAVEEVSRWTPEDLTGNPVPVQGGGVRKSPIRQSWNHFLIRLKNRLAASVGEESGQKILTDAFEVYGADPAHPLPEEHWIAFFHHITEQIQDPEALRRFNRLNPDGDGSGDR